MNKKIISIFFLLIIMVSMVFAYSYFTQPTIEEKQYDYSMDSINDKDISNEIDNLLIDENYEVEIGEMI
jgi:peptidoglycan hydrolase CwlO-like protein